MGFWNLYFAAKIYLYAIGKYKPFWWLNLLFALGLLVPLHDRRLRIARRVLAIVVGVVLVHQEMRLPSVERIISQLPGLANFTPQYMLELMQRVFPLSMLYMVVLVIIAYIVLNRWIRISTFVLLALIVMPLWQGLGSLVVDVDARVARQNRVEMAGASGAPAGTGNSYDDQLANFRSSEAGRVVSFPAPRNTSPEAQFDIILVHICSLSWDDMDLVKQRENPLFSRFDYVFQNFSGAASYSGPAAIRVLRASCGQEAHSKLYDPAPAQCHLFSNLAQLGYTPQALLNHNGQFDDFKGIVEREIGVPGVKLLSNEGLPIVMREFDNSPLVGDYDVLARWYQQQRPQAGNGPVALYYNTVSMHDGNRIPGNNMNSMQSFPLRLKTLLNDIDKVIDLVQKSGRKAVLVFVPEHGAALRGDANQIAGMREIPTPNIVRLPVGVKLIGMPAKPEGQAPVSIDEPTSFLALAQLLSNLVANSPFAPGAPPVAQYAQNLPQTRLVGENEATVTLTTTNGYVIHTSDGVWVEGK